jgi:hypothetical protein
LEDLHTTFEHGACRFFTIRGADVAEIQDSVEANVLKRVIHLEGDLKAFFAVQAQLPAHPLDPFGRSFFQSIRSKNAPASVTMRPTVMSSSRDMG